MNEAIDLALATWYPKNHSLHLDPVHPAMGLAGEAGEILNKRKKDLFKANYEWSDSDELGELGDIWYYIRILSYQCKISISDKTFRETDLDIIRGKLALSAIQIYTNVQKENPFKREIRRCQGWLNTYLAELSISTNELTALNWEKLKPGSERGDQWTGSWDELC